MKRFLKAWLVSVLAAGISVAALGFSACAKTQSYFGEYHYESWGTDYGVRVKVEIQSDPKGDRIRSVQIEESDYVEVTESWAGKTVWDEGLDNLLRSYRGRTIAEVLLTDVSVEDSGEPDGVSDNGYVIAGATVGSGRLLLAVQNALMNATGALGYAVSEGEYAYPNEWEPEQSYGVRVRVVVKDDKICGVKILPSDYIEVTEEWNGKTAWQNGLGGLLKSYEGVAVSDVLQISVPCKESGEPLSSDEGGLSADSGYVITGATVGSGRLLLAVQNALSLL